jgi:hypothetical protein
MIIARAQNFTGSTTVTCTTTLTATTPDDCHRNYLEV